MLFNLRALSVGLATGLFVCASASAERFADLAHGFSIEKPADWCVLSAAAITQDHRTIEEANPGLREAIRNSSSPPLFAFTRCAGASHGLTSTVKVRPVQAVQSKGESGQRILEAMLSSVRSVLPDLNVEIAPEVVSLAGRSAGHMKLTYTLKTETGPLRIASEMWAIPRGKYYLQIGATYPPNDQTGDRAAVMEVVSSLRLTN